MEILYSEKIPSLLSLEAKRGQEKKKKDGKGVPSFVLNPDLDTCVYSSFLQNPAYELSSLIYFFLEQEIVLARRVPDQMKERV